MVLEYDEIMDGQASGLCTRLDVNIKSLQPNPFEMNLYLYTVIRTISKTCMWLLMMMIIIYRICDYLNFWAQFSVVHIYRFVLSTYLQRMHHQMNSDLSTYVKDIWNWIFEFLVFNATFSNISATGYIMATSFSGGGSRSTRREPPTLGKQLVNFITCGCESSAPFLLFTMLGANPRRIGDRLVWVAKSNDLTHWATRVLEGHLKICICRLNAWARWAVAPDPMLIYIFRCTGCFFFSLPGL